MSSNIRVNRVCNHCDRDFIARTTVTKYCSHKCSRAAYKAKLTGKKVEKSNVESSKIRAADIDRVKAKEFLTVKDVCALLNCSPRTTYRLILNGTIPAVNLSERKTTIRRSDLDKFFDCQVNSASKGSDPVVEIQQFQLSDCYTLAEVQNIYGISDKALYELIKRKGIPKIKQGWYSYVPKILIDNVLRQSVNS